MYKSISAALLILLASTFAAAQVQYTNDKVEYTLELPSQAWRLITNPDETNEHAEFIYGDRLQGYLRIRKEVIDAGMSPSDVARRDLDQRLRFAPGFVEGKEEKFAGRLSGVTASYEYTQTGKPMLGRTYYLLADNRTVYSLRFTGLRDQLARIRNQTDMIARSFKLK
jgi:hypothetical protein